MKFTILLIFLTLLIGMNCKAEKAQMQIKKMSARSTFEAKKDFFNCDIAKQTLIDTNTCYTKGTDDTAICEEYEKKMEKELDCKMECHKFYKKYYELTIEAKKKQLALYKKNKQEGDEKATEFEIEQIKNGQEGMIEMNCLGSDLIPEEEKEKKKDKKKK